jgi:hypothetical protein
VRPVWREDGYVICSAICRWPQSQRTHNHTLLSHLRLLGSPLTTRRDYGGGILTRLHTLRYDTDHVENGACNNPLIVDCTFVSEVSLLPSRA